MNLPFVNEMEQEVEYIQNFTGYNHNLRCAEGQFYEMQNMTGDDAPVLSTSKNAQALFAVDYEARTQGLFIKDYVYVIDNRGIEWGTVEDHAWHRVGNINNVFTDGDKQITDIGALVLILPDKKIFDTETHTLRDATLDISTRLFDAPSVFPPALDRKVGIQMRMTPCTLEGETLTYTTSTTEPQDKEAYWLNPTTKKVLRYNAAASAWQPLDTAYLKIWPVAFYYKPDGAGGYEPDLPVTGGIEALEPYPEAYAAMAELNARIGMFNDYDTVNLYFSTDPYSSEYGRIGGEEAGSPDGDTVIFHVGKGGQTNFIVVAGVRPNVNISEFNMRLRFPEMSFITSLNNRIWGCSPDGTEVYACKLGDPTQWYNYAGLASDSFAATIGSDGAFTGAAPYNNSVLFFKSDRLHKVVGSYPQNFQIMEYNLNGVRAGMDKTLKVVNGYLFYLSERGVMVYDGSLPRVISEDLGNVVFEDAVAGRHLNKYYLSAHDSAETVWSEYVYDTETGQWWKENKDRYKFTAELNNRMIYIGTRSDLTPLLYFLKEAGVNENRESWHVMTGTLGLDTPYQKYISKIHIRYSGYDYFTARIYYDDAGSERVESRFNETPSPLKARTAYINVKRCDHFRLELYGQGAFKIYSIGYNIETGSEIC